MGRDVERRAPPPSHPRCGGALQASSSSARTSPTGATPASRACSTWCGACRARWGRGRRRELRERCGHAVWRERMRRFSVRGKRAHGLGPWDRSRDGSSGPHGARRSRAVRSVGPRVRRCVRIVCASATAVSIVYGREKRLLSLSLVLCLASGGLRWPMHLQFYGRLAAATCAAWSLQPAVALSREGRTHTTIRAASVPTYTHTPRRAPAVAPTRLDHTPSTAASHALPHRAITAGHRRVARCVRRSRNPRRTLSSLLSLPLPTPTASHHAGAFPAPLRKFSNSTKPSASPREHRARSAPGASLDDVACSSAAE